MQHYLIALTLFLAVLFFVLFPHKPPPAATAPAPVWTAAEKEYYRQVFSYTMDNTAPGGHYDWESYSGKGSITADPPFVSKSGATCRNYSETFVVQGKTASHSGTSCKRANDDGWCRLKPGNALTCAMETVSGVGGLEGTSGLNNGSDNDNTGMDIDTRSANPNVDTNVNVDAPNSDVSAKGVAKGVANGVTHNAGSAAGVATKKSMEWFSEYFR